MVGGRRTRWAAAIAMWAVGALAAQAAFLYSINVDTDELVLLDSDTGAVQVVGPTGYDMRDVDLAYLNGVLYGINNDYGHPAHLFAINPETGAAFAYVPIRLGVNIITNAKGLAAHNGKLVASFDTPDTQGDPLKCNGLGELWPPNGFLTNVFDYSLLSSTADLEGLGTRADGQLFSVDNLSKGGARLYKVGRSLPSYSYFADVPVMDDIEFTGDRLFGLENGRGLYELNPNTGVLLKPEATFPIVRLSGLAIPEPSAALLLLVGLLARRR